VSPTNRGADIPVEAYPARLESARDALREAAGCRPGHGRSRGPAAALFIGPGADLRWLVGYDAMALERLTLLVLPADGDAVLLVPRLEVPAALRAPAVASGLVPVVAWEETEDPFAKVPGLVAGLRPGTAARGWVLVSDRMPAAFVLRLQAELPGTPFALASGVLRDLRVAKDAAEIELLRTAARAADRVVEAIGSGRLVGRSEADVAAEVRARLVNEGHDRAAFWIVGSGPNSASPHHAASDRVIGAGDALVLDIGGVLAGYGSDITRTFWVSGGTSPPPGEFLKVYGVVQSAQAAAVAAVRPGVPCEEVDSVARRIISDAGHGDQFIHRTGHGIGLEEHEDPYIVAGNREPLRPGFAFSVEPGIYVAGRYGVRIEDIVVCGGTGPDVLNQAPRDLTVISGL
jgi:Xaa-Pro aminopeptidase